MSSLQLLSLNKNLGISPIGLWQAGQDSAFAAFKNQKDRFEFKGYKLYYNEKMLKPDALENISKIIGQSGGETSEIIYKDKPLWISVQYQYKKDSSGAWLFKGKDGQVYNFADNYDLYEKKGGDMIPVLNAAGKQLKMVNQIRIQLQRYEPLTRGRSSKDDSLLMQISPLEGYVMVNGYLVNKDTPLEELKRKLPRGGGRFGAWAGIPNLVYDATTGHDFKEYDSKIKSDGVHINFLYKPDPQTGEDKLIRITWECDLED